MTKQRNKETKNKEHGWRFFFILRVLRTRCPGAAGTTPAGNASEGVPITTDDGDHVCRVGVRLCLQAVSPVVYQYNPDGQRRWGHMCRYVHVM